METDRLANCHICGKLYVKSFADCCLDCHQETEQDFRSVSGYLKETDPASVTLEALSDATGVNEKRITNFIREGRIYGPDFPKLGYACSHCGTLIQRQQLCYSCSEQLSSQLNHALRREELVEEMTKKRDERGMKVHYWQLK